MRTMPEDDIPCLDQRSAFARCLLRKPTRCGHFHQWRQEAGEAPFPTMTRRPGADQAAVA